jgi:hypothetical protein
LSGMSTATPKMIRFPLLSPSHNLHITYYQTHPLTLSPLESTAG